MEIRNCPQCGKVFSFIRTNLCPKCQEEDEKDFKVVRLFIAKNPGVDIVTVSENTGVSENKILQYIKQDRISTASLGGTIELKCEVCGALVSNGRLCKACSDRLSAGLKKEIVEENKKIIEETKTVQGLRMHIPNSRKD